MDAVGDGFGQRRLMRADSRFRALVITFAALVWHGGAVTAEELRAVVTIKPVHALAAAVMKGAGVPVVLVDGKASPHTYALRPSQAGALHRADVFVRVSEISEPFTRKLVRALPDRVLVVTMADIAGLKLRSLRTGADFEHHTHGEHGATHDHEPKGERENPSKAMVDPHIWLDPGNAKRIAAHLADVLSAKWPQHAKLFAANAAAAKTRIDALKSELSAQLAPVAGKPFVVFHDAYQYFEKRFDLAAVGAVSLRPEVPSSARRLAKLRRTIARLKARCIFAEPQFGTKVLDAVREGTGIRTGLLDPLGAGIRSGPDHYFEMMRALGDGFAGCLR